MESSVLLPRVTYGLRGLRSIDPSDISEAPLKVIGVGSFAGTALFSGLFFLTPVMLFRLACRDVNLSLI